MQNVFKFDHVAGSHFKTEIHIRKPPNGQNIIFIVGPGGVGKSTLGKLLAAELGYALLDLDEAFLNQIAHIGDFIRDAGYEQYKWANASLAHSLSSAITKPTVFVTSSGFLSADNPADIRGANLHLIRTGYSLTLLPSMDVEQAMPIVVKRQMQRGFGLDPQHEEQTFRERFELYRSLGDMLVISTAITASAASEIGAAFQSTESCAGETVFAWFF